MSKSSDILWNFRCSYQNSSPISPRISCDRGSDASHGITTISHSVSARGKLVSHFNLDKATVLFGYEHFGSTFFTFQSLGKKDVCDHTIRLNLNFKSVDDLHRESKQFFLLPSETFDIMFK